MQPAQHVHTRSAYGSGSGQASACGKVGVHLSSLEFADVLAGSVVAIASCVCRRPCAAARAGGARRFSVASPLIPPARASKPKNPPQDVTLGSSSSAMSTVSRAHTAAPALLALLVVFGVMLPAHVVGQCTFQNEIDPVRCPAPQAPKCPRTTL
jgi:hypothetical protein